MSRQHLLMEFIQQHEWEEVKTLIQNDPLSSQKSLAVYDFLGSEVECTIIAMHQACAHNAPLAIIQSLYDIDPRSLSTRDSVYKRLPLHVSLISTASQELVLKLITLDSSTTQGQDSLGRFPLHYACNHGMDLAVLERLVDAYPQAVMLPDHEGWLPLHVACRFGMPVEVIRFLLKLYPASIHMKTSKGSTPLFVAQRNNCVELIEVLEQEAANSSHRRPFTPCGILHWKNLLELDTADFVDLSSSMDGYGDTEIYERSWHVASCSSSLVSSISDSPPASSSGRRRRTTAPRKTCFNLRSFLFPRAVSYY